MANSIDIRYSRNDLKSLKAEHEQNLYKQQLERFVREISNVIIQTARTTNNTSLIYSTQLIPEDIRFNIINDSIIKLKEQFIDASIEYKSQKDLRAGREINRGIYIDWS